MLTSNPFLFDGKVVVVEAIFSNMLSRSEAMFGGSRLFGSVADVFLVSNVPTTRFVEQKKVLLAGRVVGNKTWKTPAGGEALLTHVEFLDAFEGSYSGEDLARALREKDNPKSRAEAKVLPDLPEGLRCSSRPNRGKPCTFGKAFASPSRFSGTGR